MRFLILFLAAVWLFAAKTLDIYFIDAEVGNAILVVTPSGQAMMLDTGQPDRRSWTGAMKVLNLAGVEAVGLKVAPAIIIGTITEPCLR